MQRGKGGCLQTNLRAYELQRISSERRVEKERAASLEFAFKEMFDLLEEENRHMSPWNGTALLDQDYEGGRGRYF